MILVMVRVLVVGLQCHVMIEILVQKIVAMDLELVYTIIIMDCHVMMVINVLYQMYVMKAYV